MSEEPKQESTDQATGTPAPETLEPQVEGGSGADAQKDQPVVVTQAAKRRREAYRPSHKGTFIGLTVVALILIVNAAGLVFILRGQTKTDTTQKETVTLSADSLNKLGVSRNSVGSDGVELTVNPDASFGGTVTIAGDTTVGGQFKLNGKFTAAEAAFAKLQGGDTALQKLDVNGDATVSSLNLRKDLSVAGTTRLQGQVTVTQLMTVNNNLNVAGSLSVGGALSVKTLQVGDLKMTGNLTFGGHIITQGTRPTVTPGGAVGSNGTASGSGNDTAGTIAVNVGVGAVGGVLANVAFITSYTNTPHVVVTSIGRSVPDFYINRSSVGFSIVSPTGLTPGGYAFDFIVMQ